MSAKNFLMAGLMLAIPFMGNAGDKLIGGDQKMAAKYPSTINVFFRGGRCSAGKIGEKTFVTAAHCVLTSTGDIGDNFRKGSVLFITNKLTPTDEDMMPVTLSFTLAHYRYQSIHQMQLAQMIQSGVPMMQAANLVNPGGNSVDVAIFQIDEETESIPVAEIAFDQIEEGEVIYMGGYGCETDLKTMNFDKRFPLGRKKFTDAVVLSETHLMNKRVEVYFADVPVEKRDAKKVEYVKEDAKRNNIFNIGVDGNMGDLKGGLCPGDSGGPVYNDEGKIVGINSIVQAEPENGAPVLNFISRISFSDYWNGWDL